VKAIAVILGIVAVLTSPLLHAQGNQNRADGEIHILPVQGNVYMLVGAGANITVQAGDDGVLLVDSGLASMSDKVLAAIHSISNRPLIYIVNTDESDDHIGGNAKIAATGKPVPFDNLTGPGRGGAEGAFIIASENTFERMSAPTGQVAPAPEDAWPNDTYSTPQKKLFFNGEPIQIMHQPANTDGNSIVLFRKSDVVSAGDLFDLSGYPFIDLKAGGSIQSIIEGLNRLIDLTTVRSHAEGGTMVIPGHGRLCDQADVVVYQQMVTIVRDRIQDMIKSGKTLEQVKAAKPTADWDPLYGKTSGRWTTDMFVEAAYKSLTDKKESKK
jgi:glyoxylase-like metal-dependent hydrolase (beta-lactamase superfamily II)